MPAPKFFNKGTLRGTVDRTEVVKIEAKNGKPASSFLAVTINTDGGTNKIKATFFNTKTNTNKAQELHDQYPQGSKVEVTGKIQEREFGGDNGKKKGIDRSVGGFSMREMKPDAKMGAMFIYQGIVDKIVETEDGVSIAVTYKEEYEQNGEKKVREESITLTGDSSIISLISDVDLVKGANAKFKGRIFNKLEFDDYGDVTDNIQMYSVEKIEDVVEPSELEEPEKLDFI